MKTNKILLGLSLVAGVFAVTACGETSSSVSTNPEQSSEQQVTAIAEFKGSTTIEEVTYNVVLSLYADKTATLNVANDIDPVSGTYELIEGRGYKFTLGTSTYETSWDQETTTHSFEYVLRLGELGSGTVTLSYVDVDFVYTAKPAKVEYITNVKLTGVLNFSGVHGIELVFNEDGTYNITTDSSFELVQNLLTTSGAYTFENNTFTLTIGGVEYKTIYNLHTGAYTLNYNVVGPQATVPITLTYQPEFVLTGTSSEFGGLVFDLYTYSDGTCFADITCLAMESMNPVFDRSGTWKIVDGNFVYSILTDTTEGAEPVEFVSTINAAGQIEVNYEITGDRTVKSTLSGTPLSFKGSEEERLGGVDFELNFTSATECAVAVSCRAYPSMNSMFYRTGTYTFVDNVITMSINDETLTSTYDEETGTYSLPYILVGQQATLTPTLTYSLWA